MPAKRFLPVLDRRGFLRGSAAALIAAAAFGCGTDTSPTSPDEPGTGPDAGAVPPVTGGDAPALGPDIARCGSELCLDLSHPANASLRVVDGFRTVIFGGAKLIVIRISETSVLALSSVCTHSGCTVRYAPARANIVCPCHGSTFALDGHVTRGPAGSPLASYVATLDATTGIITIAA